MSQRVLITGGAGFIGSHLARYLARVGDTVRVLEPAGASVHHLSDVAVEIVRGDIRRPTDIARAVAGVNTVYHLAANPNLWAHDPDHFEQVNHRGTVNVIEQSRKAGVERVVHVSTESILAQHDRNAVIDESTRTRFEDMPGPYCRSKWLAEHAAWQAIERGEPVSIASPTVPVGPGDHRSTPLTRLIIDFAHGRVRGRLDGDLALIDVRDAARGIAAVGQSGQAGKRYLIAGENWTTGRLFAELSALVGQPAPTWHVPYWLALSFAAGEQWYCRTFNGRVPMATTTGVQLTRRSMRFDATATRKELGLEPAPIMAALADAVEWLGQRGAIPTPSPGTSLD
jgi:dihydroflavonol-4-reductase